MDDKATPSIADLIDNAIKESKQMLKITLKDRTGLVQSVTNMTEAELGYDGNKDKLQRMAQNIATRRTACVTIEQNGVVIANGNYLNELV